MKTIYVVIRIPKSGSQSLSKMVKQSLPESRKFGIPPLDRESDTKKGIIEFLRHQCMTYKSMYKKYGALGEQAMWEHIDKVSQNGDIITGHIRYARPKMQNSELKYITLLRDPIERIISSYWYARQSYNQRSFLRKLYVKEDIIAAATLSLSDYFHHLADQGERYTNPITRYVTGVTSHQDPFSFLIENYFHFGILEEIELFSKQFSKKMNIQSEPVWPNKTKVKEPFKLTRSDNQILEKLFGIDIELYHQTATYLRRTSAC